MRFLSKILATALVAGLGASLPMAASAAIVACATGGTGGGAVDTMGEWGAAADGCYVGDKLYSLIDDGDFEAAFAVGFAEPVPGIHQFVIGAAGTSPILVAPGTRTLEYSVEVWTGPQSIRAIDLDVTQTDIVGGTNTVRKQLYDFDGNSLLPDLLSTNGSAPPATTMDEKYVRIVETFTVAAAPGGKNGVINTAQNSIIQGNPVPEPGTLALLGLGLAGLSAFRRRK